MRLLAKEETPSDWISKKIGSYVLGHKGGAALRPNDFSDTGFPVIPKKAIQPTGELLIENPTYCTNEFASNNKRSIVDSSYTITTLRDLVPTGPTIGTVVNFSNEEKYILSQGVYGLKLNDDLDKKYLSYLSNTAFYRKVMQRIMVGSTQVHIRTPEYLDLEIQLPPLPEQQKIAKILSTWDKAISTTERLIDNSTQQKKALMQQLLTGKKRLLDESGKRFEGEWEMSSLGNLAVKVGSGKTPKGGSESYQNTGIPLIRSQNVLWGKLDLSDVAYIDEEQNKKMKGSSVFKSDILLNITGASIGRVAISNLDEANVNQHVCIIRTNDYLDKEFLKYTLLSFEGQKQIERFQAGGNRQGLNFEQIKSFKLLTPSTEEQQKIATVLTSADKEIELLEQQLADLQQEKKALMQVLLTGKKRVNIQRSIV